MRNLSHLDKNRIPHPITGNMGDGRNGAFRIRLKGSTLDFSVIASDGGGWDHVSVSTDCRCPRWEEMQQLKDMFFAPEETVMQLHPPKSEYVNNHPYCLHMWRPQNAEIPMPPSSFVGIKGARIVG